MSDGLLAQPLDSTESEATRETVWRRLRRDKAAWFSAITIVVFILGAIFAPLITAINGQDPYTWNIDALDDNGVPIGPLGGVSAQHWFGVEPQTGRDLFSIVIYGARTSLLVGLSATAVALVIGVLIGITAGYRGGWWDRLASRTIDVTFAFPALIFMITLGAIVPSDFPFLLLLVIIIGFFGWPSIARVVRAQTLALRQRDFVRASVASGASTRHVLVSQISVNLWPAVIVFATLTIPAMIGAEAALSFLGVGVPPPTPSWGSAIGFGITWVQADPWCVFFPGAALFLITLAFNLFGDSLRDALEPTDRGDERWRLR